jgi:histidinol-phosphate aminotransferase
MSADVSLRATAAVRQLAPYQPGKPISELERELGITGIVKLASNENPLGPGAAVLAAIADAAPDSWIYPDGSGFELKAVLARSLGVQPAQITLGNGSNDLLVMLAETFLQAGCSAVVSQYCFAVYPTAVLATGAELRTAPALPQSHATMPLGHDLDAMAQRVDASTRLVYIANPNNPTGTLLPAADLRRFLVDLPADCVAVLDEAYFEYAREVGGSDGIAWLERFPNLVVVRTFSKAYGLAGLRVGYAVSGTGIADMLNRVRQPFNVSSVGLAAAVAALGDHAHLAQSVRLVHAGLVQVRDGLARLGVSCVPTAGNFLLARFGGDAGAIYQGLLRAGVIVRPVGNYGLPDHLRITIGTPEQNERLLSGLGRLLPDGLKS